MKIAGITPGDLLLLRLGHRIQTQMERLRKCDFMDRFFVPVVVTPHLVGTVGQRNQFHTYSI